MKKGKIKENTQFIGGNIEQNYKINLEKGKKLLEYYYEERDKRWEIILNKEKQYIEEQFNDRKKRIMQYLDIDKERKLATFEDSLMWEAIKKKLNIKDKKTNKDEIISLDEEIDSKISPKLHSFSAEISPLNAINSYKKMLPFDKIESNENKSYLGAKRKKKNF